jgi:hypothetical protein
MFYCLAYEFLNFHVSHLPDLLSKSRMAPGKCRQNQDMRYSVAKKMEGLVLQKGFSNNQKNYKDRQQVDETIFVWDVGKDGLDKELNNHCTINNGIITISRKILFE